MSCPTRTANRPYATPVRAPFDLVDGPLLPLAAVPARRRRALLLIVLHHIVTDGWSFGVLTAELGALYSAYRDGATRRCTELAIQYAGLRAVAARAGRR